MTPYKNLSGQSNVADYENGPDFITMQFTHGYWKMYTYTNASAGSSVIQHMQALAEEGRGLNSYVSKNKPPYASKS